MCLFISIVFSLFLLCFTQQALSLFTKEQAVIGYASRAMIFTFPFYWAYAINQVYIGGLRGMGRVLPPMVITFLSYCLFRVVWCRCLLPLHSSMDVIFASYTASWFLMLICLKLYYHQELRRYDGTTTPILVKKNAA